LRAKGSTLLLDAGNALFKRASASDPPSKQRAELILRTMGELGTVAMPAGARDLNEGIAFLKQNAARAKIAVLSANLRRGGKPVFPASLTKTIAGVRVGIVGVSPPGNMAEKDLEALPVREALSEARRIRSKVDVLVLLAAVPYADALQLSKEGGKDVDFILHSNEARGPGPAQNLGDNYLIPTGDRGRQLGELELELGGSGRFLDSGERSRLEQALANLEHQLAEVSRRKATEARPEVQKVLEQTQVNFESRRATVRQQLAALASAPHGRSFTLNFEALGPEVPDDPRLKEIVSRLEPSPPL